MRSGYATLFSLLILGVITVLSSGLVNASISLNKQIEKQNAEEKAQAELLNIMDKVLEALVNDETPNTDSSSDEVWSVVKSLSNSTYEVSLKDISSAVNINTISKKYLSQMEMASRFSSVTSAENISTFLADKGPFAQLDDASDFLASGYEDFFTVYGYWNPYICGEAELAGMLHSRGMTMEEGRALSSVLIRSCQNEKKDNAQLRALLGEDNRQLGALVSTEGIINVHFAEEEVIRTLMNLRYGGKRLPDRTQSLHKLLTARLSRSVSSEELAELIKREKEQDDILKFLGCRTWFWQLEAASKEWHLKAIVALLPQHNDDGGKYYQVISRQLTAADK